MRGNYETLAALAGRIEAVERAKEDYIVSTQKLVMDETIMGEDVGGASIAVVNGGSKSYRVGEIAHAQIAERLRIPKDFYDRLPVELPGERANIVNRYWQERPQMRMLRTLEGRARAYLSSGFKPYDNFDALSALLPALKSQAELQVKSCALTERRMYVQLLFPRLTAEIKVGDVVRAGVTLMNSEVGLGAVDVRAFLEILRCGNGAIAESLLRRFHVGRRLGAEDVAEDGLFKADTVAADVEAFRLQLRDVVAKALDEAEFARRVGLIQGAVADQMKDPELVLKNVTRRFGLTEAEGKAMTNNLITGGEPTRWGLSNSITAIAKEIDNPDRQAELEQLGWEVVCLEPYEWEAVNN